MWPQPKRRLPTKLWKQWQAMYSFAAVGPHDLQAIDLAIQPIKYASYISTHWQRIYLFKTQADLNQFLAAFPQAIVL